MNTKEHFHAIARSSIRFVKAAVIGAAIIVALNSNGYIVQIKWADVIVPMYDTDFDKPIALPKGK